MCYLKALGNAHAIRENKVKGVEFGVSYLGIAVQLL